MLHAAASEGACTRHMAIMLMRNNNHQAFINNR